MVDGVTIEEARYLADEEQRHTADEETPHAEALQWCRRLVGRYGGADELANLPLEDAGPCSDCRRDVDVRYRIGPAAVCRPDAILRLRARHRLEATHPTAANPVADERPPDDLHAWARWAALNGHTEHHVRAALRTWAVDDDQTVETIDVYADERAAIHAREQAEELLLQQLDTLDGQRCDACKTRPDHVYLIGDDALCRACTLATLDLAKQEAA